MSDYRIFLYSNTHLPSIINVHTTDYSVLRNFSYGHIRFGNFAGVIHPITNVTSYYRFVEVHRADSSDAFYFNPEFKMLSDAPIDDPNLPVVVIPEDVDEAAELEKQRRKEFEHWAKLAWSQKQREEFKAKVPKLPSYFPNEGWFRIIVDDFVDFRDFKISIQKMKYLNFSQQVGRDRAINILENMRSTPCVNDLTTRIPHGVYIDLNHSVVSAQIFQIISACSFRNRACEKSRTELKYRDLSSFEDAKTCFKNSLSSLERLGCGRNVAMLHHLGIYDNIQLEAAYNLYWYTTYPWEFV